jgi:Tfp pilus assembly protein PilN
MIEINLLPPQYRAVERTPLPVFLSLIAGIALIGGAFVGLMIMVRSVTERRTARDELKVKVEKEQKEADSVDQLGREIQDAKKRVDTVLVIADSKIFWGIILWQLTKIIPDNVWLDQLAVTMRDDGSGELRMQCNARAGYDRYTDFKNRLRSDTNFFYHFDSIDAPRVDVMKADQQHYFAEYTNFVLTLPLRKVEVGGTRKQ